MKMRRSVAVSLAIAMLVLGLNVSRSYAAERYTKSAANYTIPDITLIDQNGAKVDFDEYMKANSDRPVLLQFVFTTCTTICSVLSAGYAYMQKELGAESEKVQLVSISIDPEHDTPPVIKEYLRRFNRKPGWDIFTGRLEDIKLIAKNFDALKNDKMAHEPLTYLRSAHADKWVRINGLMSGEELMAEFARIEK